jgi:hypothetical protein
MQAANNRAIVFLMGRKWIAIVAGIAGLGQESITT